MSKTLMIADEVYNKLKKIKERNNESFSTVIGNLIEDKPAKGWEALGKIAGTFRGDKEWDAILRDSRKRWKEWTKKYV